MAAIFKYLQQSRVIVIPKLLAIFLELINLRVSCTRGCMHACVWRGERERGGGGERRERGTYIIPLILPLL